MSGWDGMMQVSCKSCERSSVSVSARKSLICRSVKFDVSLHVVVKWDVCSFFNRPMTHEHFHETDRLEKENLLTGNVTMWLIYKSTLLYEQNHKPPTKTNSFSFSIIAAWLLPNRFKMFNAWNHFLLFIFVSLSNIFHYFILFIKYGNIQQYLHIEVVTSVDTFSNNANESLN